MSKIYVVSDVWFNRPYGEKSDLSSNEYNKMIIENWNNTVGEDGIVYVLGGLGVSDLYPWVSVLNGEIHILDNTFNHDEKSFVGFLFNNIQSSPNSNIQARVHFEDSQIIALPEEDVILSYYPLADWGGKDTGTIHIHGFNAVHNFAEKSFTCMVAMHEYKPLLVSELVKTIKDIEKNLPKNLEF